MGPTAHASPPAGSRPGQAPSRQPLCWLPTGPFFLGVSSPCTPHPAACRCLPPTSRGLREVLLRAVERPGREGLGTESVGGGLRGPLCWWAWPRLALRDDQWGFQELAPPRMVRPPRHPAARALCHGWREPPIPLLAQASTCWPRPPLRHPLLRWAARWPR